MRNKRDISIQVNYPKTEQQRKELKNKIADIELRILKDKYGDEILEEFINSMREERNKNS